MRKNIQRSNSERRQWWLPAALTAFGCLPLLTTGCAATKGFMYSEYRSGEMHPVPYSSTRLDTWVIREAVTPSSDNIFWPYMVVGSPFALIDLPFAVVLDTLFLPADWYYGRRAKQAAAFLTSAMLQESIDEKGFARSWRNPYGRAALCRSLRFDRRTDYPQNFEQLLIAHLEKSRADYAIARALSRNARMSSDGAHLLFAYATTPKRYWGAADPVLRNLAANPATPESLLEEIARLPTRPTRTNEEWKDFVLDNPKAPRAFFEWGASSESPIRRARVAANPGAPGDLRYDLAGDPDPNVRRAAARNSALPEEIMARLAEDPSMAVRRSVVENPAASDAVLERLAGDPDHRIRSEARRALRERQSASGVARRLRIESPFQ